MLWPAFWGTRITHDEVRPEHLGTESKSCRAVQSRSHVEEFLTHLTAPSVSGLTARHAQAKQFVDTFIRQNKSPLKDVIRQDNYIVYEPSALGICDLPRVLPSRLEQHHCFW